MNDDAIALVEKLISEGGDKKKVMALMPAFANALGELEREYLVERERLRYPKDKEFTENDRTIMLDAAISGLGTRLDTVKRIYELALIYIR